MNRGAYWSRSDMAGDIEMEDSGGDDVDVKAENNNQDEEMTVFERLQGALGNMYGEGPINAMEIVPTEDAGKEDVFRFLDLPREIRDNIHERITTLDSPLSDRRFRFKCPSESCMDRSRTDNTASKAQFRKVRLYSTICKQVHKEVVEIFFRVNSWELHRPRLRDNPDTIPDSSRLDTQDMLMRLHKKPLTKHFMHFTMQIYVAPLAYVDLATPPEMQDSSSLDMLRYHLLENPVRLRKHLLRMEAQCGLFRQALLSFSECHQKFFPKLKTLTLEISSHAPPQPMNPLYRCGIAFTVKISFDRQRSVRRAMTTTTRSRSSRNNAPIVLDPTKLDPLRRMLSPLMRFSRVQNVEVDRRWVVIHRQEGGDGKVRLVENDDGTFKEEGILETHMAQYHQYFSVKQMLRAGNTNFALFQTVGLRAHGIHRDNVIKVCESKGHAVGRAYELEV